MWERFGKKWGRFGEKWERFGKKWGRFGEKWERFSRGGILTYCRINWSDDTSIYYTVDTISIKIPFNQW
jgi:hypothetical protein